MKKMLLLSALALCALVLGPELCPAASTNTPKWFNGNFLEDGLTNADYVSILAQKAAYTKAKASHDLQGELDNAFWSSVQAWAYLNAGRRAGHAQHLEEAQEDFEAGLAILVMSSADDATGASDAEGEQQAKATDALTSFLIYTERCRGLKAWGDGKTVRKEKF